MKNLLQEPSKSLPPEKKKKKLFVSSLKPELQINLIEIQWRTEKNLSSNKSCLIEFHWKFKSIIWIVITLHI